MMRKTLAGTPAFTTTALTTAAVATAALVVATAAPAAAATGSYRDAKDLQHGVDLRAVAVTHGNASVSVVTTHTDLRRDFRSGSGGAVYLDTDPRDAGPEFVFVGGYFEGTDYALLHTEDFSSTTWGEPVTGSYSMSLDYTREKVRMTMSRKTLGYPQRVRVEVEVSGSKADGSSTRTDWLGRPRTFTAWVARG